MAESIFSGASRHASRGSMSFEVSIREHQMGLERGDTEAARTSSENDSAEVEKPVPPAARRKAGASALLENVPLDDRITLTWNNVDAYVPSSMIAPGPIEQMRNLKQKAKAKSDSDEEQHPGTKQVRFCAPIRGLGNRCANARLWHRNAVEALQCTATSPIIT